MASVNKVFLVGNLGADPEVRYTASGDPVCTLSVATSEKFKNRDGELQTTTEWHKVVLFRRLAEIASQYLKKGSSAYFEGQLKTRKWIDKNGHERHTTEIEAKELQMLARQDAPSEEPKPVAVAREAVSPPNAFTHQLLLTTIWKTARFDVEWLRYQKLNRGCRALVISTQNVTSRECC